MHERQAGSADDNDWAIVGAGIRYGVGLENVHQT